MEENLKEKTIKNSIYSTLSTVISKIGGFVFIIILARTLLPELFGIYNITLSIALFFLTFIDMGISKTLVRYASEYLGKKELEKAQAYIKYLLKIRVTLLFIAILLIVLFSKFISQSIFHKPLIYLPLIFASFYVIIKSFESIIRNIFVSLKQLKNNSIMDFFLQLFRIALTLLAIYFVSEKFLVPAVFIALSIAVLFSLFIGIFLLGKNKTLIFNKNLNPEVKVDKRKVLGYLGFASLTVLSISFFGIIDTLMLGSFLDAKYLGFYSAAFGLITSITALLGFSGVLLPVFTQIKGKQFERGLSESFRFLAILTIPAVFGFFILAKHFLIAVYGSEYLGAVFPLYSITILILIYPLIVLYSSIFEAKDKLKKLAKFGFISLSINIFLNILAIVFLLPISPLYVLFGAGLATVISRGFYLIMLIIKTKEVSPIKINKNHFLKPLISSIIMASFLIVFNLFINVNIFIGIIEVLLGVLIYFIVLYLIKGFDKNDVLMFKGIFLRR